MNNKELYQKTFSRLHASGNLEMEDMGMNKKKFRLPKAAACFAAIFVLTGTVGIGAYAATGGEFIKTVKIWMDGKETNVDFYQMEDGTLQGKADNYWIATDAEPDSLPDEIGNEPSVTENEDGIFIVYQEDVINITDELKENGSYKYEFENNGKKGVMTVTPGVNEGDINAAITYDIEK